MIRVFLLALLLGALVHVLWTAWRIGADSLLLPLAAFVVLAAVLLARAWRRVRQRIPPPIPPRYL